MPSRVPPRRVAPLIGQAWRDVGFVHWPFDPQAVQRLLPERLVVDTFDGAAWITVTPFTTTCSILGAVALPGPRRFPETNVRTYVRGPDGRDGLWFFSLDVTNRANVLLGRGSALGYHVGEMSVDGTPSEDVIRYRGRRRGSGASYDIRLEPGGTIDQSGLDLFLTGRWSAYVVLAGRVIRYDVHHQPWPLRAARVASVDETLLAAVRLVRPDSAPLAHYAAGVDARLAPARLMW